MPRRVMPLFRAADAHQLGEILVEENNRITYINFRPEYEHLNDELRSYGFEIRPDDDIVIMRLRPDKASESSSDTLKAAVRILVGSGVQPHVAEMSIANLLLSGFVIRRATIKDACLSLRQDNPEEAAAVPVLRSQAPDLDRIPVASHIQAHVHEYG